MYQLSRSSVEHGARDNLSRGGQPFAQATHVRARRELVGGRPSNMGDFLDAPAELREVIVAIYVGNLSARQAAERLGITRQQLRKRHRRAIAILRRD